ncbi:hypothetical protein [Microbacterium atlanticum]|uniref:hypothetical protein n=1 Tax=Microbacterium atlanticum TaxID=2782168 RepID=UPI001E5E914D|nr:hypothetical protein [Microbacterium atlanticum]
MNSNADDMGAVDPGMRDAERSIDAVNEGEYDASRNATMSATTDHDVIRRWAEDRHATPATIGGAGDGGAVGDLRLDFDFGQELEDLRPVSWDEWFAAFDERGLEFHHHQDLRADGSVSYDFSLEPRRTGV